jgi:hypothetical protein
MSYYKTNVFPIITHVKKEDLASHLRPSDMYQTNVNPSFIPQITHSLAFQ